MVILPGLELAVKLRRGLGNGNVVPVEDLARRLLAFDADKDGALTKDEVSAFLKKNRVGGAWFCDFLAQTLWRGAQERFLQEVESIQADALASVIHFAMARAERPVRRYVLAPEAVQGLEPKLTLEGEDATRRSRSAAKGEKPRSEARPRASARPTSRPSRSSQGPRPGPGSGPVRRPRPGPKPRK